MFFLSSVMFISSRTLDRNFILKAIITPEWKYIYNYQDNTEQLYNIKSDLLELDDLAGKKTELCSHLKEELFQWTSNSKKYPTEKEEFQLSPKEQDKLKALGYIKYATTIAFSLGMFFQTLFAIK